MNILIVEDESLIANLIRSAILNIPSIAQADIAINFDDALTRWIAKPYDMVLVDLHLATPSRNGLDFCRRIRETNPNIPLIVITSDTSFETQKKAFGITVHDYIKKPFYPQELILRVQRWLPTHTNPKEPEPIRYKELTYLSLGNEFQIRGEKLPLTKKNKALLFLFLQHPESILSPDLLQEKLWGDIDLLENKRNIRSNIQLLRHALKGHGCDSWILTI
jgi:DNA-binding response OmpR family regulator